MVGCNLVPTNKNQYFLHIHAGCRSLLSRGFLGPSHQSLLGLGELPQSSSLSPWRVCSQGVQVRAGSETGADWQCPCRRAGMSHIPDNWGACVKWPLCGIRRWAWGAVGGRGGWGGVCKRAVVGPPGRGQAGGHRWDSSSKCAGSPRPKDREHLRCNEE